MDSDRIPSTNRNAWTHVAPLFCACTALPEYGPLAPTEDELHVLGELEGVRVLELGCGSGHSLRYLADRGASEVWGVDLSPVQLDYARATFRGLGSSVRLIESAWNATTAFMNAVVAAGLRIEALVEPPLNAAAVKHEHLDPARGTPLIARASCRRPSLSRRRSLRGGPEQSDLIEGFYCSERATATMPTVARPMSKPATISGIRCR